MQNCRGENHSAAVVYFYVKTWRASSLPPHSKAISDFRKFLRLILIFSFTWLRDERKIAHCIALNWIFWALSISGPVAVLDSPTLIYRINVGKRAKLSCSKHFYINLMFAVFCRVGRVWQLWRGSQSNWRSRCLNCRTEQGRLLGSVRGGIEQDWSTQQSGALSLVEMVEILCSDWLRS